MRFEDGYSRVWPLLSTASWGSFGLLQQSRSDDFASLEGGSSGDHRLRIYRLTKGTLQHRSLAVHAALNLLFFGIRSGG